MRIVIAHNRYKYSGGEDTVVRAEAAMLRSAGHDVELLEADNKVIDSTVAKIAAAGSLFHSSASSKRMTELIRTFRPDILHIHNWFPLLSPSIISTASDAGVPVVQTLHNFRMICASANLYRDGGICKDCVGKALPLGATVHGCYYRSRVGSALVSAAFAYHRVAHTWDNVSVFIALTEFQRALLIRGGVDGARTVVKPNFVREPGDAGDGSGGYALFVGRLTPEKGIRTVLKAWEENELDIPLRIMGDGPLAGEVRARSARLRGVKFLGQQSTQEVCTAMGDARFLIFASEWHEPFGLTIVEAFSRGTPVLSTNIEPVAELVQDGETGLRFKTGDPDDLAAKARLLAADSTDYRAMRRRCRRVYEARYTEEHNYKMLTDIYTSAIELNRSRAVARLCNSLGPECYGE